MPGSVLLLGAKGVQFQQMPAVMVALFQQSLRLYGKVKKEMYLKLN